MNKHDVLTAIARGVLLPGVLLLSGERPNTSNPTQKSGYSTDLNELRTKFNVDKGKVRLLMLLSPT